MLCFLVTVNILKSSAAGSSVSEGILKYNNIMHMMSDRLLILNQKCIAYPQTQYLFPNISTQDLIMFKLTTSGI